MRSNQRLIQQGRTSLRAEDRLLSQAAEQRWANRKNSRTPALIITDSRSMGRQMAPLNCILKDTSSTGARIEFAPSVTQRWGFSAAGLPDQFRLQIPSQRVQVDCRIAWYDAAEFGVQFTSPVTMTQRPRRLQQPTKKSSRLSLSSLFAS